MSKKDDPDPWELGAARTRKDWRQMKCPPLFELFAWKRVVTDEFTYLEGNQGSDPIDKNACLPVPTQNPV